VSDETEKKSRVEPPRSLDEVIDEVRTLRAHLRDLAALLTLPASWMGKSAREIAASLPNILISQLSLELAFVRFESEEGTEDAHRPATPFARRMIDTALSMLEAEKRHEDQRFSIETDDGTLQFLKIASPLESCTVIVASRRADFPTELETFLMRAAADQAATAIKTALLIERVKEADRRKDEFIAMLGHELRNPLAPIQTALELMKLQHDRATPRERGVIERQVMHMVRLVDDLLDVSRIVRGKLQLKRAPVEIAEAVTIAIETVSPLLESRSHTLHVDVPRTGLLVEADRARLAQIVANLLSNAAKYSEPAGNVWISAYKVDGEVEISVRDDGMGISPAVLPRLFDAFYQAHRAEGGLGIGLALVKSLTEAHRGSVRARSEGIGRGSEFVIRLPRLELASASQGEVAEPRPAVAPARRALRILVVDDNRDAAELLTDALAASGHEVACAYDAASALAHTNSMTFDVAVTDIGLPVIDGYELARLLREKVGPSLRLIALTGYGQDNDRAMTAKVGFDAHFVKPVDLAKLREVIEESN
jgi:signal transduction histidine kinase